MQNQEDGGSQPTDESSLQDIPDHPSTSVNSEHRPNESNTTSTQQPNWVMWQLLVAGISAVAMIWLGISANEAARQSANAANALRSIESARERREVMPLLEIPSEEGNWSMKVSDPYNAGWQEATISFKKLRNRGNGPARKLFAVMAVNYGPYINLLPSRFAQNPDDIRVYGRFTPDQIQEIPANEEGVVNFRGRFPWPDPPNNFGGSITITITIAASDIEERRYAASFTFWAQHHVWASSGDGVQLTGPTLDRSSPVRRPPPEPRYGLKYFTMEPTRLLDFRLGDRDGLVRPEQGSTEDSNDE